MPSDSAYTVPVHVETMEFHRHDKTTGTRSAESIAVAFFGVTIETSQKISEAAWEHSDQVPSPLVTMPMAPQWSTPLASAERLINLLGDTQ